jgi:Ser/Thr protein kinase RdoA (MazF antagonist)
LRAHKPFVGRNELRAEHQVRRRLAAEGLGVPHPVTLAGSSILRCGRRWAELEEFVELAPIGPVDMERFHQVFADLGTLHRHLRQVPVSVPRPLVSAYAPPTTLRRLLTAARSEPNLAGDSGVGQDLADLIRRLRRTWVPAARLDTHLVHGDVHPGNLRRTPTGTPIYLDLGGLMRAPRIHDLAYATAHMIFTIGGRRMRPDRFPWAQLPDLVRTYEVATEQPLTDDEHHALRPYTAAVGIFYDIVDWAETPWRDLARWLLDHDGDLAR